MNAKKIFFAFAVIGLSVFVQSLSVLADECDDVKEKASRTFAAAREASQEKNYAEAIELYEEAEGYYREVVEMENCENPAQQNCARKNIDVCRKNISINKRNLGKKEKYESELKIYETYNEAKRIFGEGNSYARRQQWEDAISSFEEAAEIWESIATTETENGRRAMQSAEQARNLANLAQQRMEEQQ